jgi:hypothetical protein
MKGHEMAVYAARIGEMGNAYSNVGGKSVVKGLFGRPMDTREIRPKTRID